MAVIDAHVHLYPPEVNDDPAGWASKAGELNWAVMCARRRKDGRAVQGFPSVDGLLRTMDAAGVERAVLLGWYWERAETCARQNRFYAECVRAFPDRLSGFATVAVGWTSRDEGRGSSASEGGGCGSGVSEVLDEVRRAHGDGLCGLGELSPHAQGVAMDDPRWRALMELAGELGLPVNLHVTDLRARAYPGRVETPLVDFVALARAYPQVRFIWAHWGGRFWADGLPLPENVWVDTAATPLLYGAGASAAGGAVPAIWSEGLAALGAERVLWGTDYPLELYPRVDDAGRRKETMSGLLEEARAALGPVMAERDLTAVLGGNVRGLLDVKRGA